MKVAPRSFALAVLLLGSISDLTSAQDDSIEARAKQMSDNLIRQHEAWRTMSSPGASIQAKAVSREGNIFSYNLYVTGLPTDQLYTVVAWPVTGEKPYVQMEGVSLSKDGLVSCTWRQEGECEDPDSSPRDAGAVDFTFKPVKGEPYRFALINGDSKASIIIVPDPITAKGKGCTLDVVRLTPGFELAFFTGTGYPPNLEITFDSDSYGEKHTVKATSDREGKIHFAMMPFVLGHPKGTTRIAAVGTNCSPSLKFEWGQP
ncbi:MAG: hypothetical protein WCA10_22190 [Terracidiphilus sp.]